MADQYDIIARGGHYEVYHNGEFFCSADSYGEAIREIGKEYANEQL